MNCVIIIQARSDSKRFPRKVLSKMEDNTILWHVINRVKKIDSCDIVVATTRRKIDNSIVNIAKKSNIKYFRGRTNDVLDRFYKAANKFDADIIMRITSDCPLIDPQESNKVLKKFLSRKYDYVSNGNETYPDGLDTEVFSFKALKKAWKNSKLRSDREHVTPYIWRNKKIFKIGSVKNNGKNMKAYRWSVDYKDDLIFIRHIYARLYKRKEIFLMNDVLNLLRKEPHLMKINSHHTRNEGYTISLSND
ncbi:cytidylyltransferase domain-containing protein [Candidatus Nitrosotalea okcheonensis]|uniref:Acylneuraminate cytidylyltransferase n=1 Tax=Candidatus Nitrosotalea okcheonensis TaxID=1903276 RepID=A0A2H1FHS7_9ARCH|nr:glycosyltransferase family protein [Candidatus Nitrosotalea okcheonensis]SMH72307.1 Acylneuraminate cytidylyltransferase [Candidatus Nitrosotalea okcheonensis]